MTPRHPIALALAATGALMAAPALADQVVTFNVPVSLSHLYSDVTSLSVQCRIGTGFNRTDLPVTNGAFSGNVQIKVSVPESSIPEAKTWSCKLYLFSAAGGCVPSYTANAAACKAKQGTQLVNEVSGPVVPQGGGGLRVMPQLRGLH